MAKNPHLVRAELYLKLFHELNDYEKKAGKALDTYMANPTQRNKDALYAARDAMNKATKTTIEKYRELKNSTAGFIDT